MGFVSGEPVLIICEFAAAVRALGPRSLRSPDPCSASAESRDLQVAFHTSFRTPPAQLQCRDVASLADLSPNGQFHSSDRHKPYVVIF